MMQKTVLSKKHLYDTAFMARSLYFQAFFNCEKEKKLNYTQYKTFFNTQT